MRLYTKDVCNAGRKTNNCSAGFTRGETPTAVERIVLQKHITLTMQYINKNINSYLDAVVYHIAGQDAIVKSVG